MSDAGARYARGLQRYLTLGGLAWEWKDDMTEQDWLASEDPVRMLAWVTDTGLKGSAASVAGPACPLASDRKLRLYAVACCRQAWDRLTDDRSRKAVEVAEAYADGDADDAALEAAWVGALRANDDSRVHVKGPGRPYSWVAAQVCRRRLTRPAETTALPGRGPAQAALLRDVVGNPFRPSELRWVKGHLSQLVTRQETPQKPRRRVVSSTLVREVWRHVTWLTPSVRCLALAAYLERGRPCPTCRGKGRLYWGEDDCGVCRGSGRVTDGMLDPARLAVLADALEEAGCEDEQVLGHLRGPGPHCRGCGCIDTLLGKS